MEVTYPHYLGGNMTDGYQDNDPEGAQWAIDDACKSATILERQRIVKLLRSEGWLSPHGTTGLVDALLNFIVGHGDDLTAGDIASFVDEVISLIEGEN